MFQTESLSPVKTQHNTRETRISRNMDLILRVLRTGLSEISKNNSILCFIEQPGASLPPTCFTLHIMPHTISFSFHYADDRATLG